MSLLGAVWRFGARGSTTLERSRASFASRYLRYSPLPLFMASHSASGELDEDGDGALGWPDTPVVVVVVVAAAVEEVRLGGGVLAVVVVVARAVDGEVRLEGGVLAVVVVVARAVDGEVRLEDGVPEEVRLDEGVPGIPS